MNFVHLVRVNIVVTFDLSKTNHKKSSERKRNLYAKGLRNVLVFDGIYVTWDNSWHVIPGFL